MNYGQKLLSMTIGELAEVLAFVNSYIRYWENCSVLSATKLKKLAEFRKLKVLVEKAIQYRALSDLKASGRI